VPKCVTVRFPRHGQLVSKTDFNGVSILSEYYPNGVLGAGQLKCETLATGRKAYSSYTARGDLYRTIFGPILAMSELIRAQGECGIL